MLLKTVRIFINDLFQDTSYQTSASQLNSVKFNLSSYEAKVFDLQKNKIASVIK